MERTAVEVRCPDGHQVRTIARRRSVRCGCGRAFYVRADGTVAGQAPARVDKHDQGDAAPPAEVEPAPVRVAQPVTRVTGYIRPDRDPAGTTTPPTQPVPAPPTPAASVPRADVEPSPAKPARPGFVARLQQRRAAAASEAANRPNRHPYPNLFDW